MSITPQLKKEGKKKKKKNQAETPGMGAASSHIPEA